MLQATPQLPLARAVPLAQQRLSVWRSSVRTQCVTGIATVDVLDPWTFTGLLLGAMIPFAFSAMTMTSVGYAAQDMVDECRLQFKEILQNGKAPEYDRCIRISTEASLKEMIAPKLLVISHLSG